MSAFLWLPAPGASKVVSPRVLTADFGDGYQQHVADGINTAPRVWDLNFPGVTASVADAIETYLRVAIGTAFDWTDPDDTTGKWICSSWRRTQLDRGFASISATFNQVFGE